MTNKIARGYMWGQLISGIEDARSALHNARRSSQLLSASDYEALRHVADVLFGIEQRATAAYEAERKATR